MTEKQIRIFMELSRNLSFSQTAVVFDTTQPTITRQIQLLEEDWGFKLFDRGGNVVKLTKAGKVMADFFAANCGSLKKALDKAKECD